MQKENGRRVGARSVQHRLPRSRCAVSVGVEAAARQRHLLHILEVVRGMNLAQGSQGRCVAVGALTSLAPVLTHVGMSQSVSSRNQPLRHLYVPHSGWWAVSRVQRLLDDGERCEHGRGQRRSHFKPQSERCVGRFRPTGGREGMFSVGFLRPPPTPHPTPRHINTPLAKVLAWEAPSAAHPQLRYGHTA